MVQGERAKEGGGRRKDEEKNIFMLIYIFIFS
jgi:hypothetical protein